MNNDLKNVLPYGDTMNDGKVQLSFTLPVNDDAKGIEAAKLTCKNMGLDNAMCVHHNKLDEGYTFYVCYGQLRTGVDYENIKVVEVETETMDMHEVDHFMEEKYPRNIVVVGASTGTDAHTVGIDAIMNMKGFAGHYGLERYEMIDAYNLGSQVTNEELIAKAIELKADVILVSQTVTQKDVHIENMTNLIELLEAHNLRDKILVICGGPRISHELAKELGYDAGFGPGKFADDVASYFVHELLDRKMI
ncbi:MAG: cobalamin-dependent protein [Bacilli bacterium]|jgi:beta-lysine 5,6-aminomutase beta subunit|nr:cobalamin-dependent protein [Bacilli bacterium]